MMLENKEPVETQGQSNRVWKDVKEQMQECHSLLEHYNGDEYALQLLEKIQKVEEIANTRLGVLENLLVTDAVDDDNSTITVSVNNIKTLGLSQYDTVLVKAMTGKETVLTVLIDGKLDDKSARINSVGRYSLHIEIGHIVTIRPYPDIGPVKHIAICPFADTVMDFSGSIIELLVKYFSQRNRPIGEGDCFKICDEETEIEFKVVKMEPAGFGIVKSGAIIYGEGKPIERADDESGLNRATINSNSVQLV